MRLRSRIVSIDYEGLRSSFRRAAKGLSNALPMIVGVVFLMGLVKSFVPKSFYIEFLGGSWLRSSLMGSGVGSVLAGNPVTSYIIGGEMLSQGVGLYAVTSFILAWVTVGIVQFPAESEELGRRFALTRNVFSFLLALAGGFVTVAILGVL
ncbi:MAG: permease [Candidatus Nanohaloarchaeota archaeon QJJ-9]|nr:permease [Candidatus Nanohaloarchaeota archaeon QJJ-9]